MSNPKSQNGRGTSLPTKKPTCRKCGKKHYGECLLGMDNCFGCGKSCHKVKDFPNVKEQYKGSGQAQASGSNVDDPRNNCFYSLRLRGEQESSPDVVTCILQVFSIDVYGLIDLGATLSFVTPLIARKFEILSGILNEPFLITTMVGESVVVKRVYRNCPIMLPNRVNHVELVELDMIDFDVILGMDWLHDCFAFICCRTTMFNFNFPNELALE